jgi:F-type H+-transporting ATPase subunit delta
MSASRIAARYAEALFDLARERDAVAAIRGELDALVEAAERSPELARLLERPDLPAEQKLTALRAVLGDELSQVVMALLAALVNHSRGEAVDEVAAAYGELADESAGVLRAEAMTVLPLSQDQQERMVAALRRVTGKQIRLEARVDPRVLAGVRLRVGNELMDGSAAGRLASLREELINERGSGT